ncbi:class I SAM-dependent methyltransferase [Sphingomonas sp. 28-62-20]|uniref:class I SAM-dependent methyltransferase n=1 Tax=Sphingomonas sp. 28-62-20 TaxID=1970433 RepID=UPI0026C3B184
MTIPIFKSIWRWSIRRKQFTGDPAVLDAMYQKPDPWNLVVREQPRFVATNALIAQYCPRVESLLEIGCGEGAQTRHFSGLAKHVTGVDLSPTALARARAALPAPVFLEGRLGDLLPSLPRQRYDIATLCEVLIYGNDPAGLIADAQRCADHLLVTNFEPQSLVLAHLFQGEGWQELPAIEVGQKRWRAYFWTGPVETT